MRRPVWMRALALLLVVLLTGCNADESSDEAAATPPADTPETVNTTENESTATAGHTHTHTAVREVAATCSAEGYTIYICDCGDIIKGDFTEKNEHTFEQSVISPTTEAEGYTLYMCAVCGYAYKDNYTDKIVEDRLTTEQKNSIAMLNYLATLTQEISTSGNSRMLLEKAYAALINNTNPEKVNELTEEHLCSLLDTIEKCRIIAVKRERLEFLYNQNKANAIRAALPSPLTVLKAVTTAMDLKRLVASVTYMAVDSISSYNAYNDELDHTFLQDGWDLDVEEAALLHESRKNAFLFMVEIVREQNLPGELALSESAVESFVSWTTNDNIYQRLQFLESEEDTYRNFGNYWLACAECYYQLEEYQSCLDAVELYKEFQADIFRKDYNLAQAIPMAIASAEEAFSEQEYIDYAEEHLKLLIDNTEGNEWSLRYFAAQVYVDLYTRTKDMKYLDKAYDLALNNVNFLVNEQKQLTAAYLADIQEVEIPDDAAKEKQNLIKDYNRSLKANRKTELPAVYKPLLLNCELLFALLEIVDVSAVERERIDAILDLSGSSVFLTTPVANRYASETKQIDVSASFDKTTLTVPGNCVSANSVIRVRITDNNKTTVHENWTVKKVERSDGDFASFLVTYTCESIKYHTWSDDSTLVVEIFDEAESEYEPIVVRFKGSITKKLFWETVEFEQLQ